MSTLYKKYFFVIICFILVSFVQNVFGANKAWQYNANSVLSQGDWYKIKIEHGTGVYKLTYDDLKKIGLNNPADVKIYGYGGWILDEDFRNKYVDDLPEVSIWMSNDRESFGKGDYILFYARGDIKWEYDAAKTEFVQTQNPYSFDSYYFVTESSVSPKLMETQSGLEQGSTVVNTFNDYVLHEQEKVNIGKTGREFYGENLLTDSKKQITFSTQGATSNPAKIRYEFVSKALLSSAVLKLSLNGNLIDEGASPTTSTSESSSTYAKVKNNVIETQSLKDETKINWELTTQDNKVSNTYLNYIRINYVRQLKPYGAFTLFRNVTQSDNLTYQISDASSSVLVMDVTDNTDVSLVETRMSGSTMNFSASNSTIREYALVDISKTDFPKPTIISGKVANQNLHALSNIEMIIIAPEIFVENAQELADLHKAESGLVSYVVTAERIYNEFSSGKPDVTAYRRFLKMFYDRASGEDQKLRYVLLFGCGTFDNRFVTNYWAENDKKKATLLTYQSKESLLELQSFVSDDYIGFLNDNVNTDKFDSAILEVGIGRLPVQTSQEAQDAVAKIKEYMMNQNKGLWLNNIAFVADDFVGSSSSNYSTEKQHIEDAENFSKYIEENYPDFIINKIYEDAFERVTETNGYRYPTATQALLDRINNGVLALNFIGHGSTSTWTHEYLLQYSNINALANDKLGLWITATCDFSRYDSNEKSAGELALLKRKGGAIALFSTVRTVYISHNTEMNRYITKHLLTKENGKPLRLGDILRNAKSEPDLSSNISKLRFTLLGDPALRLAYPDETYKIEVSEINGVDVSEQTVNIRSLDDAVIVGHVVDAAGNIVTDYTGILESVIFDSEQELKTLGNGVGVDKAKEYKTYPNTLFAGRVEVKNGEFQIRFTVPKDILSVNGKGKMNFYSYDETGEREAQGSFYNYTVGGTNPNVPEEENPPVIERLILGDVDVDLNNPGKIYVGTMPKFYVQISDDSGINLSSATGHNISLVIDDGVNVTEYNLSSYFVSEDGSSKRGTITYTIPELDAGNYTLEFEVWDVFNNSTSVSLDFTVTNDTDASNYTFEIWGNPAKDMTKFVFKTKVASSNNVDIRMSVYSLSGQLVWLREEKSVASTLNGYEYDWDLSGNGGGRLSPGVYICSGQVVIDGKAHPVQAKKIIISN